VLAVAWVQGFFLGTPGDFGIVTKPPGGVKLAYVRNVVTERDAWAEVPHDPSEVVGDLLFSIYWEFPGRRVRDFTKGFGGGVVRAPNQMDNQGGWRLCDGSFRGSMVCVAHLASKSMLPVLLKKLLQRCGLTFVVESWKIKAGEWLRFRRSFAAGSVRARFAEESWLLWGPNVFHE